MHAEDVPTTDDPVLRPREAAAYAALSLRALQAAVARGVIRVVRLSPRRIGVRRSEMNRFIAECERRGQ